MPATIQNILKPTRARGLDTSGNNNHAQIYSGRALEFDGVTDYLDTGMTELTSNGKFTIAGWFYINKTNSSDATIWSIADWETSSIRGIVMRISSSDLKIQIGKAGSSTYSAQLIIDNSDNDEFQGLWNSWHRYVVTVDSDASGDTNSTYRTLNCYVDGVLVANEDFDNTPNHFQSENGKTFKIGKGDVNAGTSYASMKASDVQFWDKVWTQDDVTYDYLNPEQLALNRGGNTVTGVGTQLTESNLKLWYPMNEGHRGDQYFISDASSVGLGENIVDEAVSTGDSVSGLQDFGDTALSVEDGAIKVLYNTHASGMYFYLRDTNILTKDLVVGRTYKITLRAKMSDSQVTFKIQGATPSFIGDTLTSTEYVETSLIFKATSPTGHYFFTHFDDAGSRVSGQTALYIDSMTVKPINGTNNATTVFYGEEQITDSKNRDFGSSSDWAVLNIAGGSLTEPSNKLQIVTSTDEESEGAQLAIAEFTTPVIGRTYRISATMQQTSGATTPQIGFQYAGTGSSYFNISASAVTYTKDIVAVNTTGNLKIFNTSSASSTTFTIDDVSVKEVGIATGWTDADQQLDIPQTALQSYNELGWNNQASSTPAKVNAFTPDLGTGNFSISFCMLDKDVSTNTRFMAMNHSSNAGRFIFQQNAGRLKLYANTFSDPSDSGTTQAVGYSAISSYCLSSGKWHHVVASFDRSADLVKCYVDGVYQDTDLDISSLTGSFNAGSEFNFYNYTDYLQGSVTEIAMWKGVVLDADDAAELYNEGKILDALTHSKTSYLLNYWRNTGLGLWQDLKGSAHITHNNMTNTMLITAGVDSSRDSQGFLMNRQKLTNSLNFPKGGSRGDASIYDEAAVVQDSSTLDITGDFTISFWVKFKEHATSSTRYNLIMKKVSWDGNGFGIHQHTGKSMLVEYAYNGSSGNQQYSSGSNSIDTLDVWYHVCFTHEDSVKDAWYVTKSTSATLTNTANNTTAADDGGVLPSVGTNDYPLVIGQGVGGGQASSTDNIFPGEIDDICIYNGKALTDKEVLRNFNAGKRSHR